MKPQEAIAKHELTLKTKFVPFSQSRNSEEKNPSLNWKVTLLRKEREILTTDYMAGCANCPAYKNAKGNRNSIFNDECIRKECESGFPLIGDSDYLFNKKSPLLPKIEDVVYSLLMDSDVIDYPTYEEWAGSFGYDPDSRAGEKIYRSCLEIALRLRSGIGESALTELREAFQDY